MENKKEETYYSKNKKKVVEYQKEYYERNRAKILRKKREDYKKKINTDDSDEYMDPCDFFED